MRFFLIRSWENLVRRKGSVLITAYVALFFLLALGGAFFSRTISEKNFSGINLERVGALQLAEAAADEALVILGTNSGYTGTSSPVSLGQGEYESVVTSLSASRKRIVATGYIPSKASATATRQIEMITKKETPPNFYDYAIYSAGEVDLNGGSYVVNGDVIYSDSIDNPDHITGSVTQDATISPLAAFGFETLRDIAIAQGNLYDAARLDQVRQNKDSYPGDFWFVPPTDPLDPTTGIPNVVYVEGNMVVSGNFGNVGGFFLVVGNVLTDPDDTSDSTINGNGTVDGCVYATGKFDINGGAGGINVNGGVWAGDEAEMGGNSTITYDLDYMMSIKGLVESNSAASVIQMLSWREL